MNNIMLYADNMEKTLNENQTERASLFAQQMKAYVDSMESILESLVPHEDLHNLSEQIEDASLSLRIQDYDDLRKALSLIKENAEHLIRHEAFCFSNIF